MKKIIPISAPKGGKINETIVTIDVIMSREGILEMAMIRLSKDNITSIANGGIIDKDEKTNIDNICQLVFICSETQFLEIVDDTVELYITSSFFYSVKVKRSIS